MPSIRGKVELLWGTVLLCFLPKCYEDIDWLITRIFTQECAGNVTTDVKIMLEWAIWRVHNYSLIDWVSIDSLSLTLGHTSTQCRVNTWTHIYCNINCIGCIWLTRFYLITQQFTWSHSFADTCVIIDLYTVYIHAPCLCVIRLMQIRSLTFLTSSITAYMLPETGALHTSIMSARGSPNLLHC